MALLREIPDAKDRSNNRQIIEIWKNGYLHNSLDLGQLDKHGKVYTDGEQKNHFLFIALEIRS